MSLSEETLSMKPSLQMPFTSCGSAIKQQQVLRDEIDIEIQKYLASGGQIHNLTPAPNNLVDDVEKEPTWSSDDKAKKRSRAHKAVASRVYIQSPISYMDGANRTMQKASSGHQNIQEVDRKRGTVYSVTIGSTSYGTCDKLEDAITKRDAQREILGMEKALY